MIRYFASSLRSNYETQLIALRNDLRIITKSRVKDPQTRKIALSTVVVLHVANLENYFSDLINLWLRHIETSQNTWVNMPETTKAYFLLYSKLCIPIRTFIRNDGEVIKRISRDGLQDLDRIINSCEIPLALKTELRHMSFPSVKNIKAIYKRIGLPSVFSLIDRNLKQNSSLKLQSLLDKRGEIAHIGTITSNTPKDIREDMKWSIRFVRAVDRVTYYHLRNSIGVPGNW